MKLKIRLFYALTCSVLLYNCKCWAPLASDVKSLEGFYFRCMRRISRDFRKPGDGVDKASRDEVFRACNVPTIDRTDPHRTKTQVDR